MVLVISYVTLKEVLKRLEIVNMLVSFTAVVFIVCMSNKNQSNKNVSSGEFILGIVSNAMSALCFSIVNVILRSLKEVHHSIVASFQSTGNFVMSLAVLVLYRTIISPNGFAYNFTMAEVMFMLLIGVCRSFSMLLFIRACQLDKAGRTAGLNFLQIIFGYLADTLIFGYSMQWFDILGASVIIASSITVFLFKYLNYSND